MECVRCGKDVSEWARVCAVCGARVSQTSEGSPRTRPETPAKDARSTSSSDGAIVAVFLVLLIALGAWFASNEEIRSALSSDDVFVRTPDLAVADTDGETLEDLTTEEAETQDELTPEGAVSEEDTSAAPAHVPPQPTAPPRTTTQVPDDPASRRADREPPRSTPRSSRTTWAWYDFECGTLAVALTTAGVDGVYPPDFFVSPTTGAGSCARRAGLYLTREALNGLSYERLKGVLGEPDRTSAAPRSSRTAQPDREPPAPCTSRSVPSGVTRESLFGLHHERLKNVLGEPDRRIPEGSRRPYRMDYEFGCRTLTVVFLPQAP